MKKKSILRIALFALIGLSLLLLLFQSCKKLNGNDPELLKDLYRLMGNYQYAPIKEFLPIVNDDEAIEFNINLTDNLLTFDYTYYLKCKYSEDEYHAELSRLKSMNDDYISTIDEENKVIYWDTINYIDGKNIGRTSFRYAMWSEDDRTIVYVESRSHHPATARNTIPDEYWFSALDDETSS